MVCMIHDDDSLSHDKDETANSAQRPTLSRVELACTLLAECLHVVMLQLLR